MVKSAEQSAGFLFFSYLALLWLVHRPVLSGDQN